MTGKTRQGSIGLGSRRNRVRTPTILQFEATECGAVALAIVLAHHGRYVSLDSLRQECGISRDGSKAVNLLQAARRHGLEANGAKVETVEALAELPVPFIVFWQFDHFIVVEGIDANKVYINDPASGPRVVGHAEFDRGFTGIALLVEPGKSFVRGGVRPSIWRPLHHRLTGSWDAVAFVALATLALVIPGLLLAGLSKVFIDHVLIGGLEGWLWPLLLGVVMAAVFSACIAWIQELCLLRLRIKLGLVTAAGFLWHTLHLPLAFFQQRYAGDIGERVDSNDRIAQFLSDDIAESTVGLLTVVLYASAMFVLESTLAMVVVVIGTLNVLLFVALARPIGVRAHRFLQDSARLSGIELGGLQTIETLRATGTENELLERRASAHAASINTQRSMENYSRALELAPDFLIGVSTVAILGLGAQMIMAAELTVGTLVAFETLALSVHHPLQSLLDSAQEVQMRRADLLRLDDSLRQDWDPYFVESEDGPRPLDRGPGRLGGASLTFGYSEFDAPVLQDIDVSIVEGQRIAVVGRTGSGKTTLVRLLCGLITPQGGAVERSSNLAKGFSTEERIGRVSLVDQDSQLFEGTIRENLTLWDNRLTNDELWRALDDACVADVVAVRGGLEARVAEGGANFSGGERQRLEIARALAANPTMLILDEATGALDAPVEKRILDNVKARRCGTLIIAHRLSAVRDCDEILVMDTGAIVSRGSHDELARTSEYYCTLLSWEADTDA